MRHGCPQQHRGWQSFVGHSLNGALGPLEHKFRDNNSRRETLSQGSIYMVCNALNLQSKSQKNIIEFSESGSAQAFDISSKPAQRITATPGDICISENFREVPVVRTKSCMYNTLWDKEGNSRAATPA